MQPHSALVLIADGSEEMEAVISIDVLRRAGLAVTVASVKGKQVTCSRQVQIVSDTELDSLGEAAKGFDVLVLPGGLGGAKTFKESHSIHSLMAAYLQDSTKHLAIICASPIALAAANLGHGRRITSHPSVKAELDRDYVYLEERVVVDGNLITSRGPGTSFEFALTIVEQLLGAAKRNEVAAPMILP
ncbi:class I glutamine amidotransferase-like protein [Polychytrium aggregatum]|uniref:class I glutamine amidotransferase-like protein n=1 Tax=Polychytrium aggregatum TaxID=110093 RepID=UPI0022FE9149|nr:class I glutamine amidotransferase-like protein [Polychytrium aggregatum]KAI9190812.1 class I glutamine amidotransferase-like protein [Polychytrium aggregatum]